MDEKFAKLNHSASHVMAAAVRELFPEVKLGIGPAIEEGFYYDFDLKKSLDEKDLEGISKKMKEIVSKKYPFTKKSITKKDAEKLFKDEPYKLELLKDLDKPTTYESGKFIDLCAGPHVEDTSKIKAFKLSTVSTAYWKGDSKRPMLQRIYGIAFDSEKGLEDYLKMREEAEKRDHTKLGKELDLYMVSPYVGKGLPFLTPKGAIIKQQLQRWVEDEEAKRGYQITMTPVLSKTDLYKLSGHLDHYRESMFVFKTEDNEELALRPMTCPFQFLIYKNKPKSYKELPIRYSETSPLFRREQSGELHGLTRLWQFTLADAHIICRPEQVEEEFEGVLNLIQYIMKTLGFQEQKDYWYKFSKWDPKNKEKYIDNPKAWDSSQKTMKKILDRLKLKYTEVDGDAAFYGPKLDFQMKNVWGKEDTFFTIQIDFALPERFDMTYTDQNNKEIRPMVIHRASIGCYERTIAMLIEKYAGKFPLWLSPTQVLIASFTDRNIEFAEKIAKQMKEKGIRTDVDLRNDTVQSKVRDAELQKIPYIIVIGDKEEQNKTLAVRVRGQPKPKFGVNTEEFIEQVLTEINNKMLGP